MRLPLLLSVILAITTVSLAQETQHWTERAMMGFRGPVRSVMTTVQKLHDDPRPADGRTIYPGRSAEWFAFDTEGRRTEMSTGASPDKVLVVSRRTLKPDGTEVWTDSGGNVSESRKQESILPDGTHEIRYYFNSKVTNRETRLIDKQGRIIAAHAYDNQGRCISEESATFDTTGETTEWKTYGPDGDMLMHVRTYTPEDHSRFDRWAYQPDGKLAWQVSVNGDGELLSSWYAPGYHAKVSSSDSLGICRPKLCVSYKFNDRGELEKTVQHIPGGSNVEPDSEEHYDGKGELDEKVEIKYVRDSYGNWISRSVFVWDPSTNEMVEVERDSRKIEYY